MLLPIENVLSQEEAQAVQQQLQQGPWRDGRGSAGPQAVKVKQNQQLDSTSKLASELGDFIQQRLQTHPLFISAALPKKIYPPMFNCYQDGGHYGLHVDSAIMLTPTGSLRTDLSATLFLSDGQAYDGGELCIETQYGAQRVKLNAGDLLLYPATSLHQVEAVTRGRRLCAVFWIQSLVRSSEQRSLLFDLDQSIQALGSARGTQDQEVRRLSGIYHNLLRQWAD